MSAARLGVIVAVLLSVYLAFISETNAQETKGGGSADQALTSALRKAQTMLHRLADDNRLLKDELRGIQAKLKEAERKALKVDELEPELAAKRRESESLRNQNLGLVERINRDAETIKEQNATQQELSRDLSAQKQDNALLVQAVKERERWIASCSANNIDLIAVNRELLEKYTSKGMREVFANAEPFTQIGRVAAENEEQAYRFRLQDLAVTPWQEASGTEGAQGVSE